MFKMKMSSITQKSKQRRSASKLKGLNGGISTSEIYFFFFDINLKSVIIFNSERLLKVLAIYIYISRIRLTGIKPQKVLSNKNRTFGIRIIIFCFQKKKNTRRNNQVRRVIYLLFIYNPFYLIYKFYLYKNIFIFFPRYIVVIVVTTNFLYLKRPSRVVPALQREIGSTPLRRVTM